MGVSVLPNVPDDVLIETLRAYEAAGRSQRQAARQLGVSRDTVQQRLAAAHARNLTAASTPDGAVTEEKDRLRFRVKTLEAELSQARSDQMTTAAVRREIIRLRGATADIRPPRWVQGEGARRGENILTPVTIWSDWHWGEVVEAAQVNGINAYSLEIANQRAERAGNPCSRCDGDGTMPYTSRAQSFVSGLPRRTLRDWAERYGEISELIRGIERRAINDMRRALQ